MNKTCARRKLPIGIQNFRKIREGGYYYVDKTDIAKQLIESGEYYFLSRPRRFGKSLFVETLRHIFQGDASLFTDLAIAEQWDWSVTYPVIRLSFAEGVVRNRIELDEKIRELLQINQNALGVVCTFDSISGRFAELIRQAHAQFGQRVVVLIDEYDKPILDNIEDADCAREIREGLKNLYSVIKGQDENIRFAFVTGVSKFSKVSLFSGLNNLQDITLDRRYATICGYTEADVDTIFAPELPGLNRAQIRQWYNGYNWLGEGVYNPADLLQLFSVREFRSYWFETGTPTFLVKLLRERQQFLPALEHLQSSASLLSNFDVDDIATETLMFQTGYLTIADYRTIGAEAFIRLRFPNREVRQSLASVMLTAITPDRQAQLSQRLDLYQLLQDNDLAGLRDLFQSFYASIPHDWYRNNPIAQYEGYYASVFYSYFAALGLEIRLEDSTSFGRIDMTVLLNNTVYLFEFKVVEIEPDGAALQQLKDRGYADKYRQLQQPIYLIGVEFSKNSRNIVGFSYEQVG